MNKRSHIPKPENEPVLGYAPGSPERAELAKKLAELKGQTADIPLIIGGKEVRTGKTSPMIIPHDNKNNLGRFHKAGAAEVQRAIDAANAARAGWANTPWRERAAVFRKAAELLAGPWRSTLNAATMLGQSKTPHQAEIDAACELTDFYRFNPHYLDQLYAQQPPSPAGEKNRLEFRPMEGFIFALTPFNFTAIAGNLPATPALMGNTVIWKPASTAVLSAYYLMKLLQAAGLPDGVINLIPGPSGEIGTNALDSADFAGLNFTGSTPVFNSLWTTIARNLYLYKDYPRIVGETGGKGFIFAHNSCDPEALKTAIIRGSYEYQGQKCSAASRAYIPRSLWNDIKEDLLSQINGIKMGPCEDFSNFMNAVIDKTAYDRIKGHLSLTRTSSDARILAGGECDETRGYFIRPTLIGTSDPRYKTMCEEIFGPVMTVFVYEDDKYSETLKICDATSPYALTGSVFARDKAAIKEASGLLADAAGNFYINDKPTGAMVDRQPFGGGRSSGTNDKVGWPHNLLRWTSVRTIKENLAPPTAYRYPYMGEGK
ncbi:MAG: L-glutamate gamma-semialdehyde dehydrogenase [Elusimicrobia bacterium]|nr:L-glutamate gamma-semialdehyde dehydrogenase [Elusimicrobiota bacterium]